MTVIVIGLALVACSRGQSSTAPAAGSPTTVSAAPSIEASAGAGSDVAPLPEGDARTVERVIDGDTIVVDGGERIRFIGIDTPETVDPRKPVQCFGREASAFTTSLLPSATPVQLVFDVERTDRYGRTLAYVYRVDDGVFVNAALVEAGFAVTATYPPNVAHVDEFTALAAAARDANRGLWSACGTPTPSPPTTIAAPSFVTGDCDPAYPDTCIPAYPPDLDCSQVSARRFRVDPPDPHGFDGDGNGVGCQSG